MKDDLMFSSLRSPMAPAPAVSAPERPLVTTLWFGSESVWMRRIARIVLATWLMPLLFAILTVAGMSAPAQAQSNAQTVVVLDFAVAPGLDPLLGRKAADGLAVELQRSQDYEIVPRQRVEEAVLQQAGLQPPFNDTAQIRLAQTVNASSVFSGRVVAVNVNSGRSATVTVEVRQLDAGTGDYVNGTQVVEPAEQRLQPIANEILVDEAINKASFSAVRSMRQTALPVGKVLNTTLDDAELSIGARNGVGIGQRYSVLRDVYNKGRNVTERVKIAEITITRVEDDQAVGKLAAGGSAGVRTGDYIRQIFVPGYYPVSSASANGGSITPVTAPPSLKRNSKGIGKSRASKGLLGILGLAAAVSLAGLGGGSGGGSNSSPAVSNVREATPDEFYPTSTIDIKANFGGINISDTLRQESVIAYAIFRGTNPSFATAADNLQAVIDARNISSGSVTRYNDIGGNGVGETVAVSSIGGTDDDDSATCSAGISSCVLFTRTVLAARLASTSIVPTGATAIGFNFNPEPFSIGQTYYYKVQRITAERVRTVNGGDDGDDSTTTVNIFPVLSNTSKSNDGYTPLFRPEIETTSAGFSLDNLIVTISADRTGFFNTQRGAISYEFNTNSNVGEGADTFRVQISRTTNFDTASTVTTQEIVNPAPNSTTNLTLNVGPINIPPLVVNGTRQDYQPGDQLYMRVLARNNNDSEKRLNFLRRSLVLPFTENISDAAVGAASGSRFLKTNRHGALGASRVNAAGTVRRAGTGAYTSSRVAKPK